jgi:hypothetical protein
MASSRRRPSPVGPGYELQTTLVNVAAWQHGTTIAVAAGFVSQALLGQFLAAIH